MEIADRMIYIIGAGAIGQSLAVFLQLAGKPVTLVRGSIDDGTTRTEHIRVEKDDGIIYEAAITIATLSALKEMKGIIVLANKSYGNEQLATTLKYKTGQSPVVLLQNGLGVEKPFLAEAYPEVYRSVLFVTSQFVSSGSLRFKPVAFCPVGIERGNSANLEHIVRTLHTVQFGFKTEEQIVPVIWKKAIINCVFNSICPLLEADNGIFYREQQALAMARAVIEECVGIARAKSIWIETNDVEENLLKISRSSDGQLISTLQDIRSRRQTEIDTLNFEMVRIAERMGKADCLPVTKLLGELTRMKAEFGLALAQS